MIAKILAPTDGSAHAKKAVAFAADLAARYGAELDLIHVSRDAGTAAAPPEMRAYARIEHIELTERDYLDGLAREILEGAAKAAQASDVEKFKTVQKVGDPAGEVIRYAAEAGVDLIVMGTRGLGTLESLLLGSVARKVGDAAPCSCVTVR